MRRPTLDRVDRQIVLATLAVKVALLVLGVVALAVATGAVPGGLLDPWHRWDAPHFTDLAVWGYQAVDEPGSLTADGYASPNPGDVDLFIVFYPLYPWLVATLNALVHDPVLAAFLVTTVASLFVGPLLRRVVAADLGETIGRRSVVFLLLFPTAYFLHIGYTEALFMALALGSFWFARTDRWWLAGLLAGLAALTRVNGLVLLPVLLVEAGLQWWPQRRWRWSWLGIGLVPIGFGVYLAVNLVVYGDPFAFVEVQRTHWFKDLSPPWEGLAGIGRWVSDENPDTALMLGWMELAFVALGLVATLVSAVRFRPSWTTWMAGNWLLFVSTGFVLSVPRYSLVLFPMLAWCAVLAERRWIGIALAAVSSALLGWFAWRFASGAWAF
jgi:hypothetical protein